MFVYYEAESEDVKVFGDWAVNNCGDIVNYTKRYPIYCYVLTQYNYDRDKHWLIGTIISVKSMILMQGIFFEALEYAYPLAMKHR